MSLYVYRVLQSTWGISINMDCQVVWRLNPLNDPDFIPMCENIYLETNKIQTGEYWIWLPNEELESLRQGVMMVRESLINLFPKGQLVIKVEVLEFASTDYQTDALAYVMAGWLGTNFNFPYPQPNVKYDKAKNRYIFS